MAKSCLVIVLSPKNYELHGYSEMGIKPLVEVTTSEDNNIIIENKGDNFVEQMEEQ